MNGNKRVVTRSSLPFKTLQGRCRAIKAGSGLYRTAANPAGFKRTLKNLSLPFYSLSKIVNLLVFFLAC